MSRKLDCTECERIFEVSRLEFVEVREPPGFWEETRAGRLCDECRGSVNWVPIQVHSCRPVV